MTEPVIAPAPVPEPGDGMNPLELELIVFTHGTSTGLKGIAQGVFRRKDTKEVRQFFMKEPCDWTAMRVWAAANWAQGQAWAGQ